MSDQENTAVEVKAERQWPLVVELTHPVVFGSETIASLKFRRGRIGDLKGCKIDDVPSINDITLIASRMCGQPVAVLDLLDGDDGGEVVAIVLDFFVRYLGAGKKR